MKQLTGNQVRQMFLDYFKSKGHMIEPGASLTSQLEIISKKKRFHLLGNF